MENPGQKSVKVLRREEGRELEAPGSSSLAQLPLECCTFLMALCFKEKLPFG